MRIDSNKYCVKLDLSNLNKIVAIATRAAPTADFLIERVTIARPCRGLPRSGMPLQLRATKMKFSPWRLRGGDLPAIR
jgi:hypothetical protein